MTAQKNSKIILAETIARIVNTKPTNAAIGNEP